MDSVVVKRGQWRLCICKNDIILGYVYDLFFVYVAFSGILDAFSVDGVSIIAPFCFLEHDSRKINVSSKHFLCSNFSLDLTYYRVRVTLFYKKSKAKKGNVIFPFLRP